MHAVLPNGCTTRISIQMQAHNFSTTNPNLGNTWNTMLQGVSQGVSAITPCPPVRPQRKSLPRQSQGVEGLLFYAKGLFGLVFVKDDLNKASTILRGEEAFKSGCITRFLLGLSRNRPFCLPTVLSPFRVPLILLSIVAVSSVFEPFNDIRNKTNLIHFTNMFSTFDKVP